MWSFIFNTFTNGLANYWAIWERFLSLPALRSYERYKAFKTGNIIARFFRIVRRESPAHSIVTFSHGFTLVMSVHLFSHSNADIYKLWQKCLSFKPIYRSLNHEHKCLCYIPVSACSHKTAYSRCHGEFKCWRGEANRVPIFKDIITHQMPSDLVRAMCLHS